MAVNSTYFDFIKGCMNFKTKLTYLGILLRQYELLLISCNHSC